eukprot:scaffold85163_cov61-Phaeocystis_antarctica.AAC.4
MDAEGSAGVGREERGGLAPAGRQLMPRAGCLERDAVDAVGRGLGDEERILLRPDADARELGRRGDDLLEELACIVKRPWWGQRLWRRLARAPEAVAGRAVGRPLPGSAKPLRATRRALRRRRSRAGALPRRAL